MQGGSTESPLTFDREKAYQRVDANSDTLFYSAPRMTGHIDSQADEHLVSLAGELLRPGDIVLDLMASVESHLPDGLDLQVAGLGMNSAEMTANHRLNDFIVRDVNSKPELPYPAGFFDAVLCNLSIEYLTDPETVIREAARILKPSGRLLVSFSNRWFPPKVTRLWQELHEFERLGYVLQLCRPHFNDLQSYSFRNWPRPTADKHFPALRTSDPLYAVTGTKQDNNTTGGLA